jgi:DNA invertase Pin-like site-specific DNA recombinase
LTRRLAAVPDQPGRVVLYVRVSALMGRAGDTFHSPDVQLGAMRRATAGWREVDVVQDLDRTGTTFAREGIERIRRLAERREIDAIAVYDVSRLGRNVLESLLFLRELTSYGVTVISASEAIDTSTDVGEMMLINLLNLAQYRSREVGRAWRQTIAARARAGRHHGRVPAGYRRGPDGRLQPDQATGPAVQAAFEEYAAGDPVRVVRRRLCDQLDTHITESAFKRLLANTVYRGTVRLRPRGGEPIEVQDAHPPLVDQATWERVQRRIRRDRRTPSRVLEARYSITGLAVCGRCEGAAGVTPQRRPGGRERGHGVFCRDHRQGRGTCAGCGMLTLAYVEAEILRQVTEHIARLRGDVAAAVSRTARAARAGGDAARVDRELADTRAAMVRLADGWARGQVTDPVYEATMAQLAASEQQLVRRLDELQEVAAVRPVEQTVQLAEHLVALWPQMLPHERQQALRSLVGRILIRPASYRAQPARGRVVLDWL